MTSIPIHKGILGEAARRSNAEAGHVFACSRVPCPLEEVLERGFESAAAASLAEFAAQLARLPAPSTTERVPARPIGSRGTEP